MDRQPVLEGERLLLRPLTGADWPALYAVAADPLLWALHPLPERCEEPVFRAFFEEGLASGGAMAVIDKPSGRIVGSSRFSWRDPPHQDDLEIGSTFIDRSLWGTGINAELKRLMLGYALQFVPRVIFRVGRDNARSRTAMSRIGAKLTGEPFVLVYHGRELPHVLYEVTREGFEAGPLNLHGPVSNPARR